MRDWALHGRSEYLVNFFTFLAEEVREYLAEIGVEKLDDIIGRTDLIVRKPQSNIKKHSLINFDNILTRIDNDAAIRHTINQQHGMLLSKVKMTPADVL